MLETLERRSGDDRAIEAAGMSDQQGLPGAGHGSGLRSPPGSPVARAPVNVENSQSSAAPLLDVYSSRSRFWRSSSAVLWCSTSTDHPDFDRFNTGRTSACTFALN